MVQKGILTAVASRVLRSAFVLGAAAFFSVHGDVVADSLRAIASEAAEREGHQEVVIEHRSDSPIPPEQKRVVEEILGRELCSGAASYYLPRGDVSLLKEFPFLEIHEEEFVPEVPHVLRPAYLKNREGNNIYSLSMGVYRFDPLSWVPILPAEFCVAFEPGQNDISSYYIVQLWDTPSEDERARLKRMNFKLDQYLPQHAFLEKLTVERARNIFSLTRGEKGLFRWIGPLQPAYKLSPALVSFGEAVTSSGTEPGIAKENIPKEYEEKERGIARLNDRALWLKELAGLARDPEVLRIEPVGRVSLRNQTTAWVIQTNKTNDYLVHKSNIRGQGEVIGLIDDHVDLGHCFFRDSRALGVPNRKFKIYESSSGIPGAGEGTEHGTFVAGILAGGCENSCTNTRIGHAPEAKIAFAWFDDLTLSNGSFYGILSTLYNGEARIFSNSWGDDTRTDYTGWAREADLFSRNKEDSLILFAVKNEDPIKNEEDLIATPENAKNVLAVGASHQATGQDFVGRGAKSGVGKMRRPEILAPGCSIFSTKENTSCGENPRPSSCATSWACPAVAGAAALVRQYLRSKGFSAPSGALMKAMLLNGTDDMVFDVDPNDPNRGNEYPSDREGWGRLVLAKSLELPAGRLRRTIIKDVRNEDGPDHSKDVSWTFYVDDPREELKVTLVWMDEVSAPMVFEPILVNDLNLTVRDVTNNESYHGNKFEKDESMKGATTYDDVNNVEQVVIKNAKGTEYAVTVSGDRIEVPRQGFALVITGAVKEK